MRYGVESDLSAMMDFLNQVGVGMEARGGGFGGHEISMVVCVGHTDCPADDSLC